MEIDADKMKARESASAANVECEGKRLFSAETIRARENLKSGIEDQNRGDGRGRADAVEGKISPSATEKLLSKDVGGKTLTKNIVELRGYKSASPSPTVKRRLHLFRESKSDTCLFVTSKKGSYETEIGEDNGADCGSGCDVSSGSSASVQNGRKVDSFFRKNMSDGSESRREWKCPHESEKDRLQIEGHAAVVKSISAANERGSKTKYNRFHSSSRRQQKETSEWLI